MITIESIFDLLDWNCTDAEQALGREKARQMQDIAFLIQPSTTKHNKNVWDNCAVLLAEKSDTELEPYFMPLLEWLQDLNWPGAFCIMDRLLLIHSACFVNAFCETYKLATQSQEDIWLNNLSKFVEQESLLQKLETPAQEDLLKRYKQNWR